MSQFLPHNSKRRVLFRAQMLANIIIAVIILIIIVAALAVWWWMSYVPLEKVSESTVKARIAGKVPPKGWVKIPNAIVTDSKHIIITIKGEDMPHMKWQTVDRSGVMFNSKGSIARAGINPSKWTMQPGAPDWYLRSDVYSLIRKTLPSRFANLSAWR